MLLKKVHSGKLAMAEAPPEFEETTTEVIKAGYLYKQGLVYVCVCVYTRIRSYMYAYEPCVMVAAVQ